MTRAILVALCLGLLVTTGVAAGLPRTFQEQAAVQESLARVHPRMRASWLKERGLDDSYYTTFHRPESTSGLECIGRWPWGPSWELAGKDTFLYLGSGSGVRILSIADSVHPRMLGQINARSLVSQVVVQDSLLFVACGSWGAQIYSVPNPANPRELGSMDAVIGDLCVKDSLCYTAGGDSFRIYNVADPASPRQLGAHSDTGALVVVVGSHAFVADGSGMNVYDVSIPSSPQLVNSRGGSYATLFVRDTLLFCSDVQPSYFAILDVSDPLNIRQVGNLSGYGGHGLCVDDYFAYLSCAYDHEGIFVIDITNPTNPQLRDSLNPFGTDNYDSYVPAPLSYGYVASDEGGLVVVDMHNVSNLGLAWEGYVADQSMDIAIDGTRAYVADNQGGTPILDISNPAIPTTLGQFDTLTPKYTSTVTARDSFAFIAMSGIPRRQFLRVLDVLDPSNPTVVAQESCYNPPEDYVLNDSLLYAAEENQFQVFNVTRPREPVLVGSCNSQDGVYFGLAVQDTFAYVAADGLQVINVAKVDSPTVVGGVGRTAMGIAVRDTFVYLPYVYDTLFVYSVANPAQPRQLASVKAGVWPSDITLGGSRGYVALNGGNGVETFDLANPASPVSRGHTSAPYAVRRVCYSNGLVYASMWEAGVAIYETTAVGIGEQGPSMTAKPRGFRVWPSLTSGEVRFVLCSPLRNSDISVYDMSGKRLEDVRLRVELKGGATEGVIGLAGLPAGVYVVRVKPEGRSFTAKVVKPE